jgi:hypothetical protein
MVFGDIQGLEIVVVAFHLRAFDHFEAHAAQYVANPVGDLGDGVQGARGRFAARQ